MTRTTKRCVECKSEMPEDARKCRECGEYQHFWRRGALFFAAIAGAIALVFAGATFSLRELPKLRSQVFPKANVDLISFSEAETLTLANSGDGDVYIRSIELTRGENDTGWFGTKSLAIDEVIKSKELLIYRFSGSAWPDSRYETVEATNADASVEWAKIAQIFGDSAGGDGCYAEVTLHPDDPNLRSIQSYYESIPSKPITIPGFATLEFYSFSTRSNQIVRFPVKGLVFLMRTEECVAAHINGSD